MTATTKHPIPATHTLAQRLEFAPPTTRGGLPSALLALLVHLALVGALALSVQWKQQVESPVIDAELWSAVPTLAAAKAQEPAEPEQQIQPPPAPIISKRLAPPIPIQPPPQSAPAPVAEVKDAQIALEREKKREKRKAEALAMEQQAERITEQKRLDKIKKRDEEKQAKAKEEALEKEKLAKTKFAEKTKKREADQRLADEHEAQVLKAEKAEKTAKANQAAKAAAAKAEEAAGREKQMQRIMGMAGASGDANATGTTQKSSGPSANYANRIAAKIKGNIVFPDDIAGNPVAEVEVRTAPDGSVVGTPRVTKSSGVKSWDDAVVNAILKTETLPRDVDGRIPPVISMRFKPKD